MQCSAANTQLPCNRSVEDPGTPQHPICCPLSHNKKAPPGNYYRKKVQLIGPTWIYNHIHNILRLFEVLPNFLFTTSETMGYYYL